MILSKSYKEIMDKIYVDDAMKQRILQNIEREQIEKQIPENIEQKQTEFFTSNSEKKHIFHYFHYRKMPVCAAILLIFCFASYFGVSTILHTGEANQHNVTSDNKKDSLSANVDTKDTDSKSANADTKDTDSNQLNSDTINTEDEANMGEDSDMGNPSMEAAYGINQYSSAKKLSQKVGFNISDIPSSLIPFKISEKIYSDCGDGLAEIQYYSDKADNVVYRKQTVTNADVSGDYTEYSDTITVQVQSTDVCLKGEQDGYNLATWSKGDYSYSLYFLNGISEKTFENILKNII